MSENPKKVALPIINFLLGEGPVQVEGRDGLRFELPESLREQFHQLTEALLADEAVRVIRQDKLITTQEAAEILGVDRTTVVRLIEEDLLTAIRFTQNGHRRLRLTDVLDWKKRNTKIRRMTW